MADFRKVSSRRIYQFQFKGSTDLAAIAYSDWVFIERDHGQPIPIPDEIITAFFPTRTDSRPPRKAVLPTAPPPPEKVFTLTHQVAWRDLDALRHVNNANYLIFAEECSAAALAAYGWPIERLLAQKRALLAAQARVQYLLPAVLGDQLAITSWMYPVSETRFGRHFGLQARAHLPI